LTFALTCIIYREWTLKQNKDGSDSGAIPDASTINALCPAATGSFAEHRWPVWVVEVSAFMMGAN